MGEQADHVHDDPCQRSKYINRYVRVCVCGGVSHRIHEMTPDTQKTLGSSKRSKHVVEK